MVIEKVFGLNSTGVSLNDRFTLMSATATTTVAKKPVMRYTQPRIGQSRFTPGLTSRLYSDAEVPNVKQRLRNIATINALKQQAWQYGLIRQALLRGRSLTQNSVKNRLGKQALMGRGFRYSFRWNRGIGFQSQRPQFTRRFRPFNQRGRGKARVGQQGAATQTPQQNPVRQTARRGRPFVRGGRGRGRGGLLRQQQAVSKDQLDQELDQYMACTKAALDKQLDEYMQDAVMDIASVE